ncbi:MAG: CRISPR-associated endonuclease Cas1 [Aphanocapsa lilacina HA4352-LM1]|jgi:CRISPR-associated protein Cas1|nr:CRISPR-associated endonuclease Cas1 [Aphanocapsa lilacina HA4352-LM1]
MNTLYLLEQGCTLSLAGEVLRVRKQQQLRQEVSLPTLKQVLVFGTSQLSTGVIRVCLYREIRIAYLSRQGRCYGRLLPTGTDDRRLVRLQHRLDEQTQLGVARAIVQAKIHNSRVMLMRCRRRRPQPELDRPIQYLEHFARKAAQAESVEQLRGYEGASAAQYFPALGCAMTGTGFVLVERSRRPPLNPVNAMLSFGYQVLWNHVLAQLEIQGLDTCASVFHTDNDRHPALASDLLEEFRAPIVDALVLWLVNSRVVDAQEDFDYHDGGCYLNETGRRKFLGHFIQRMNEEVQIDDSTLPRWGLIERQVLRFKQFLLRPDQTYQSYRIR